MKSTKKTQKQRGGTMHDNNNNLENVSLFQSKPLRKALIMAGGFGSRMKELTKDRPKPMLSLQGKPILEYSIDLCKRHGIDDIAISVYYFKDQIKEYFGDGSRFGVRITYVEEPSPLGTAGGLWLCREWTTEPFMMCNADELKDVDLTSMYTQHVKSGASATIALRQVDDPSEYGVVDLKGNAIKRFVEKPAKGQAPSNYINAGLYILNPSVVDYVPIGRPSMMEKDVFPRLAEIEMLSGFVFDGQWFDTGTPERYNHAEKQWKGFKTKIPHKSHQRAHAEQPMNEMTSWQASREAIHD